MDTGGRGDASAARGQGGIPRPHQHQLGRVLLPDSRSLARARGAPAVAAGSLYPPVHLAHRPSWQRDRSSHSGADGDVRAAGDGRGADLGARTGMGWATTGFGRLPCIPGALARPQARRVFSLRFVDRSIDPAGAARTGAPSPILAVVGAGRHRHGLCERLDRESGPVRTAPRVHRFSDHEQPGAGRDDKIQVRSRSAEHSRRERYGYRGRDTHRSQGFATTCRSRSRERLCRAHGTQDSAECAAVAAMALFAGDAGDRLVDLVDLRRQASSSPCCGDNCWLPAACWRCCLCCSIATRSHTSTW